jgi:hypothetical protein
MILQLENSGIRILPARRTISLAGGDFVLRFLWNKRFQKLDQGAGVIADEGNLSVRHIRDIHCYIHPALL